MKRNILFTIGIIMGFSATLRSQNDLFLEQDSIRISNEFLTSPDSLALNSPSPQREKKIFQPNPTKAIIYSAIFPGLGQIYNRKYWKLPIVYGAFTGCAYAITWNNRQYNDYKQAYVDFTDKNPNTHSWKVFDNLIKYCGGSAQEEPDKWSASSYDRFTNSLNTRKNYFRRNLELSYIISVGVYALCMIDAYVDAQLFEFDISEDLSFKLDPVIFEQSDGISRSIGLQCSIIF